MLNVGFTSYREIKNTVEDIEERLAQKGVIANPFHTENPDNDNVEISKEVALMLKVIMT